MFLTVCTEKRAAWLAQVSVQDALHRIWRDPATAWLVGDYVLMPDHLHLFCAPHDLKFTIERWMAFWKDRFVRTGLNCGGFQAGGFHHRLREDESYAQKWQYVRENPVRQGLVSRAEDWAFLGGCMRFGGEGGEDDICAGRRLTQERRRAFIATN